MMKTELKNYGTLWLGGQTESWVYVEAGKIIQHIENDGYAFMRNGPEGCDTEITLARVEQLETGRTRLAGLTEWVGAHLAGDDADQLRAIINRLMEKLRKQVHETEKKQWECTTLKRDLGKLGVRHDKLSTEYQDQP